jgi:adenine deaminase
LGVSYPKHRNGLRYYARQRPAPRTRAAASIGLSPREVIAAATSNFADIYGWRDIGRIELGREADVLILESDPRSDLEALDHIDMMLFQGAVVNRKLLLEAREANREQYSNKLLILRTRHPDTTAPLSDMGYSAR